MLEKYNENEDELYTDFVKAENAAFHCDLEKDITNLQKSFTAKPHCPFIWCSVHTFVECKTSKCKMKAPPKVYTYQPVTQPLKHKYLGVHVPDHTLAPAQSHMLSDAPTLSATYSRPSTCEPHEYLLIGWS